VLGANSRSPTEISPTLLCWRTTVYSIVDRFIGEGRATFDDRKKRGPVPLVDDSAQELIEGRTEEALPTKRGWLRSRWSCKLLSVEQVLSKPGKVGASITAIIAEQDRTRGKAEGLLREVAELIEERALMEGTLEWLSELGRSPYSPLYPPNLEHGDLTNLRKRLMSNDLLD
jgi:hypothetical protein